MAKIIYEGLAKRDDPMFSEPLKVYSVRRPKPSEKSSQKSADRDQSKKPVIQLPKKD